MRNRVLAMVISIGLMACPVLLGAQSAPAPTGGKVAVIDIQQAILDTAEGRKAVEDLQKKFQPRETEIQQRQKEVQELQQQLQKQMTTLSADEQRQMQHELQEKQTVLRRLEEDAQSSFQYDRNTIMQSLGQKMVKVIDKYASSHGYSLVLDGGQVPVYYAAKGVDITPEIVKLYNASHPVQTASASTDSPSSSSNRASSGSKATPKPQH